MGQNFQSENKIFFSYVYGINNDFGPPDKKENFNKSGGVKIVGCGFHLCDSKSLYLCNTYIVGPPPFEYLMEALMRGLGTAAVSGGNKM